MSDALPDSRVLGRLLLVQGTLHVMPHTHGIGDLVCQGLSTVPGVKAMGLCVEGKVVGRSEGFPPAPRGREGPETCPASEACGWRADADVSLVRLQTVQRSYGCLVVTLEARDEFKVYEPYIRNTANTLAMTLENREQDVRLRGLNEDLRRQVVQKEAAEAALRETQRGLERTVVERTLDLVQLNEALVAEVRERKLAQETSAWEAALNGAAAKLAKAMMQAVRLDEMATLVLGQAVRLTDSPCGLVGRFEPHSGHLVCDAVAGDVWGPVSAAAQGADRSGVGDPGAWVLRSRDPRLANVGQAPLGRFLSVPVLAGDEVLGQISLANAARDYTERDLELTQRLAELYTLAVLRDREGEERRHLSEQVQRAQRLETVGVLAGGIAHDFRNLLQIIQAYVDLLRLHVDEASPARRALGELAQAVERGAGITAQLLAFSRKTEIRSQPLDLNEVVKGVARLLEHTLPKMIRVELSLAPDVVSVAGDRGQLEQVLVNLAVNARDAMPAGGILRISVDGTDPEREAPTGRASLAPGDYVAVHVRDTGQGMDEKTVARVFEPFFTTKAVGNGTGLGLSVAYGIVSAHGGHIHCSSAEGHGSTFSVYLPRIEGSPLPAEGTTAASCLASCSATLLVVDDEEAILEALETMLSLNGFRTLTARNGEDALSICRERGRDVDLVIVDLGMPGAGGEACVREIMRSNAKARVIVSSGYASAAWAEMGARAFLAKPFRLSVLLDTVRQVLNAPAA